MKIEILGIGCAKCEALARNAEAAVRKLGIDAEIIKVTDIMAITSRGVMMTPALAVDGQVKSSGRLLSADEIGQMLSKV
jgi:small redox-active disulfide protein 2